MTHVELIRSEVQRLFRSVPFQPFVLNMKNGDRIIIEHPENIAFEPTLPDGSGGSEDFHVISNRLRFFSTFDKVTNVALVDHDERAG